MNIKDLKSLLKVLRDNGVTAYEHDGVKLSLLEAPVSKEHSPKASLEEEVEPSMEELLLYSTPSATDQ